jgi:hypothetical protein
LKARVKQELLWTRFTAWWKVRGQDRIEFDAQTGAIC